MTTILVGITCFILGGSCGALIGAMLAAAGRADDRATSMCVPAGDLADRLSDRLVHDFHVVTDDQGMEHLVPTEASPPPAAEGGSPPAG